MLEATFQGLIKAIVSAKNSHLEDQDKRAMLSRDWEFIFSDWDGWLVLNCYTEGLSGYWLYPMLYPKAKVNTLKGQLPSFNIMPSSVAYEHCSSGSKNWIEPTWGKNLTTAEIPLFFCRLHYGRPKGKENYIEFNQVITHPLDLHWSPEKNAYCRIDDQGEEIEKIKVIEKDKVRLILMRTKLMNALLYLGNWVLIRYVDFTRYRADNPSFKNIKIQVFEPKEYEGKFEIRRSDDDEYVEIRGAHIYRPQGKKDQLLSSPIGDEEEENKYAEFTVYDWKNKKLLENYSIAPRNFANYFTESDLPFETSPIFFKAEVLDKYKNNPDKYELSERHIVCRGGWYLKTFDINKHNQVHTYAVYLARLPYKEQLHWLQYNEKPKGSISRRAFQTDFEGQFPDEESKLDLLRRSLELLGSIRIGSSAIWVAKGGSWESASKGLFYVNSENPNQWHDFIIALCNVTIEGFQTKSLKEIASRFGTYDEKLRTLGLIRYILESTNHEAQIPIIHGVLNDLQINRGKGKAHGGWSRPEGSLIDDANRRLENVILAIQELTAVFEELAENISTE